MTDLVERLIKQPCACSCFEGDLHLEAADEIERLRAALEEIIEMPVGEADDAHEMRQVAREALRNET